MDRLEEWKNKYNSVLQVIQQQGVRLTHLHVQDNKLFLQGAAPSQDVKNNVWNQIKAVDASLSDITCDLNVDPSLAPPKAAAAAAPASAPSSRTYKVQPGDTLSKIAQQVPQEHLAAGLAEAFRSNQTPAFPEMLSNLFSQSNGQQRAGILNQLLGAVAPSAVGGGVAGTLSDLLKGGTALTPQQAEQVTPEAVQQLAEHAQKNNPSIGEQASNFYAQHPRLVQGLGAGALALIMSHISQRTQA